MKSFIHTTRRQWLAKLGRMAVGLVALRAARPVKAAVKTALVSAPAPKNYDPFVHSWRMCIDIDKCIGCGLCAEACKKENNVIPKPAYFRTWVERYVIKRPEEGSDAPRGETVVDSPNGGIGGFPPSPIPREQILKSFFVPKLCNHCANSPCDQACPVGATFRTPDGVVVIDPKYCIGCGFCIQACPYGCRFLDPITRTANKCTLCYHRISRGLTTACVEVCPTGARILGDMKNLKPGDPVRVFLDTNKIQVLKPHLGTDPRLLYAGLDKEVR
jgi:tetrathionate reductase subunit B